MAFAQLGLNPLVVKAVEASGYTEPTAVQIQAIPATLQGTDLLVPSQTGSGKTAAFMLPCLHRLDQPSALPGRGPRVLVQSGVVALQDLAAAPERGNVRIYFDPVTLKDTKQLSKITLSYPEGGVAKRTTVLNATISFNGPATEIEAWTKRIDFKKVLSQIDR